MRKKTRERIERLEKELFPYSTIFNNPYAYRSSLDHLGKRINELEKVNSLLIEYLGVERIKPDNQEVIRKKVSRKMATKK